MMRQLDTDWRAKMEANGFPRAALDQRCRVDFGGAGLSIS